MVKRRRAREDARRATGTAGARAAAGPDPADGGRSATTDRPAGRDAAGPRVSETAIPRLAGAGSRPPAGVVRVGDDAGARALANRLLTPGRRWPVALISTAAGNDRPYVDAEALKAEIGDLAEVVVLSTGSPSWAFSEVMPHMTQVYGGASRVYDVEHDWVANPRRSTLRFAYSAADGPSVVDGLTHDVLNIAVRSGILDRRRAATTVVVVGGKVAGLVGERALVLLDDGGMASVPRELAVPGLSLEQVLQVGQRVEGGLDRETRFLDLRAALEPATGPAAAARFAAAYTHGDVVLARVGAVSRDVVELQPLPGFTVRLGRDRVTGNERDQLDDLFTTGEVVAGRVVVETDEHGNRRVSLRLDDIDDDIDEPLPAPALLDGGPPWLLRQATDTRPWEAAPPSSRRPTPSGVGALGSAGAAVAAGGPAPGYAPGHIAGGQGAGEQVSGPGAAAQVSGPSAEAPPTAPTPLEAMVSRAPGAADPTATDTTPTGPAGSGPAGSGPAGPGAVGAGAGPAGRAVPKPGPRARRDGDAVHAADAEHGAGAYSGGHAGAGQGVGYDGAIGTAAPGAPRTQPTGPGTPTPADAFSRRPGPAEPGGVPARPGAPAGAGAPAPTAPLPAGPISTGPLPAGPLPAGPLPTGAQATGAQATGAQATGVGPVESRHAKAASAAQRRKATQDLALALEAERARVRELERDLAQARDAQLERDQLRDMLADAERDLYQARQKAAGMTARYREADRQRQQLKRQVTQTLESAIGIDAEALPPGAFADPVLQFRAEVWIEWARRVPAGQKEEQPLAEWSIGPGFLASLEALEGVPRSKIVSVVVEILTGVAPRMPGREVHMLRRGPGGDDPPRTREDGATAYRASLQRNTPAARRIHYWSLPGGAFELIKVGTHDDVGI